MEQIYKHITPNHFVSTPPRQMRSDKRAAVGESRGFSLGPIRYRRMADQIAAMIRESIADGKLSPGTHLFEAEIAREMQTSRIPVREALIQLEQEGLVVRKPSCGTFVTELTEKMMREVSTLRGLLEGYAASQAVKRLTASDFMHLDALVKEMLVAANAGDFLHILDCDYQFHVYVIHAAGHDLLEEVWRATHGKTRLYLSATNLMYANLKSTAQSHANVLEGLRSGDPERARKATEAHTKAALEQLVTRVLATPRK